jgi:hypothetical protein
MNPPSVLDTLTDVNQSLKPFRPPTAPASDMERERKAIQTGRPSFLYIQLALFILLAVLVSYLALPMSTAHGLSFLLLCVGIAVGFFLRK